MAKFDFMSEENATASPWKRRVRNTLILAAALGIGGAVLYGTLFTYVRPYETAIKQSRYGGGIDPTPHNGPRLYVTGPGVTYHRFPTTVLSLTMTSGNETDGPGGENQRTIPSLEIDSSDGSKIRIDATVLYRVVDPYKVIQGAGPGRLFEDNIIIPKSQQALKESLGRLKAEDFYDENLRVKATSGARDLLNAAVVEFGLAIDHVLIRQYYYQEEYQRQIEERKVQDQLVFTNQSAGEAAKTEALRTKLEAEGQAAYNTELKRGEAEVSGIRAEADLYSRKRRAEADLLVKLAEARGTELENDAYRSSNGSDNLVGLQMAEVLEGVEVIFVESGPGGVNLLDVNQTLGMFDVGGN